MKRVVWSVDAKEDFAEIISYIKERAGTKISREIVERLRVKVASASDFPEGYRAVPELHDIGINDIREIIESPWRILFRSTGEELRIVSVIDGRRNIEEVLFRKIMDGKLK